MKLIVLSIFYLATVASHMPSTNIRLSEINKSFPYNGSYGKVVFKLLFSLTNDSGAVPTSQDSVSGSSSETGYTSETLFQVETQIPNWVSLFGVDRRNKYLMTYEIRDKIPIAEVHDIIDLDFENINPQFDPALEELTSLFIDRLSVFFLVKRETLDAKLKEASPGDKESGAHIKEILLSASSKSNDFANEFKTSFKKTGEILILAHHTAKRKHGVYSISTQDDIAAEYVKSLETFSKSSEFSNFAVVHKGGDCFIYDLLQDTCSIKSKPLLINSNLREIIRIVQNLDLSGESLKELFFGKDSGLTMGQDDICLSVFLFKSHFRHVDFFLPDHEDCKTILNRIGEETPASYELLFNLFVYDIYQFLVIKVLQLRFEFNYEKLGNIIKDVTAFHLFPHSKMHSRLESLLYREIRKLAYVGEKEYNRTRYGNFVMRLGKYEQSNEVIVRPVTEAYAPSKEELENI